MGKNLYSGFSARISVPPLPSGSGLPLSGEVDAGRSEALRIGKSVFRDGVQCKGVSRLYFQAMLQIFLNMEFIRLVIIRQLFIPGVSGDVILIGKERPDTTHLQDAFSPVHDGKFVLAHQCLPGFLIAHPVAAAGATGIAGVVKINGFFAEDSGHFFECAGLFAA